MADLKNYPILSVCATVGSRVSDLLIEDGQLIFIQDKHKIALDYNGKRVFYNQIEEIATEQERKNLLAPVTGFYYFVIDTAVLWTYQNKWIQITTQPENVVQIDTEFPESLKDEPEYREFRIQNTPLRRIGTPEDGVGAAMFLATEDSDFVTGETIVVDGGLSIYVNGIGQ